MKLQEDSLKSNFGSWIDYKKIKKQERRKANIDWLAKHRKIPWVWLSESNDRMLINEILIYCPGSTSYQLKTNPQEVAGHMMLAKLSHEHPEFFAPKK
jgi:hypothetical protein